MGKQFEAISDKHQQFIENQQMFFVATAAAEGRVNVSPKGMDSLRILGENRAIWLNVTGSGNETACHISSHPRMTLMFCAFEGAPMTLRLYGTARVIHQRDDEWQELAALLPDLPGARQIFDLSVDLVQTSCGMSVPLYDYVDQRDQLYNWADRKTPEQIERYWHDRNQTSIDGVPTGILAE